MGFPKEFLWGDATAANQCEGGFDEDGRGLANVDVCPKGEDRAKVICGKMKMYDFLPEYEYPAKLRMSYQTTSTTRKPCYRMKKLKRLCEK